MSRASRQQKAETQLRVLEQEFSNNLISALRECAGGVWGMFGQNDSVIAGVGKYLRERLKSKAAEDLIQAGNEIERLRQELGYNEPFQPYRRYLDYRQMQGSNTPGEPNLAVQFLKELGLE